MRSSPLREAVLADVPGPDRPDAAGPGGPRRRRRPAPRVIALRVLVTAVGVALGVFYPFISVILAASGSRRARSVSSPRSVPSGSPSPCPAWGHLADVQLGRPRTLQICARRRGGRGPRAAPAAGAAARHRRPDAPVLDLRVSCQPLADALTVNAVRGRDYARVRTVHEPGLRGGGHRCPASCTTRRAIGRHSCCSPSPAAGRSSSAPPSSPTSGRADLAAIRRRAEREAGGEAGDAAVDPAMATADSGPAAVSTPTGRSWHLGLGSVGVALRVAPRLVPSCWPASSSTSGS